MDVTAINKIIIDGDRATGEKFIGVANSQMNILLNQMSFQKLKQGVRRIQIQAGVFIECRKVFDYQECRICVDAVAISKPMVPYISLYYGGHYIILNLETRELVSSVTGYDGTVYNSPYSISVWALVRQKFNENAEYTGVKLTQATILVSSNPEYSEFVENYDNYETTVAIENGSIYSYGAAYRWIYSGANMSNLPSEFHDSFERTIINLDMSGSTHIIDISANIFPVRFPPGKAILNGTIAGIRKYESYDQYSWYNLTSGTSGTETTFICKYYKLNGDLFVDDISLNTRITNIEGVTDNEYGASVLADSQCSYSVNDYTVQNSFFDLYYNIGFTSESEDIPVDMSSLTRISDSTICGYFGTSRTSVESYMNSDPVPSNYIETQEAFVKNIVINEYFTVPI